MKSEKDLLFFFKNEKVLLAILFLVFINPFFYGNRLVLFFFVFLISKFSKFRIKADKNVFFLLFFSLSYELIAALKIDTIPIGELGIITNILSPALLYLVGKYVGGRYSTIQVLSFMLFFMAFTYSLVPLISILKQIADNSFLQGTRSMYLLWNKNEEISATILGSYLTLNMVAIGLFIVKKDSKYNRKIYYALLLLFLLSLLSVIRLGSRTQLAVSVLAIIISFVINFSKNNFSKNIGNTLIIICTSFYLYNTISASSDVLAFFADRIDNDEAGIGSAGGRVDRWIGSFNSIFTDPFGWEYERFGYSHNLWLDVARVAGIVSLFFLLLFTISSFAILSQSLKKLGNHPFIKTYVLLFFTGFFLVFTVEPILDGMYMFFLLYCMFIGILSGFVDDTLLHK